MNKDQVTLYCETGIKIFSKHAQDERALDPDLILLEGQQQAISNQSLGLIESSTEGGSTSGAQDSTQLQQL